MAMEQRHIRNIPALSEEDCRLLGQKTVTVVGCGGLGGYLVEQLARLGVGNIRCVDGDVFEESNLNRQLLCTQALLGAGKAEAAAERIRAIDARIQAQAYPVFLEEANARTLIAGCDAVLDALDNVRSRKILTKACTEENIPYIYGAVSGWTAQAAICMPAENLLETLYPGDVQAEPAGVLSFTPALCASVQTALCVKWLTGRPVQSGVLHCWDLLGEDYAKMQIK